MSFHRDITTASQLALAGEHEEAELFLKRNYPDGFAGRSISALLIDMYRELNMEAQAFALERRVNGKSYIHHDAETLNEEHALLADDEADVTLNDELPVTAHQSHDKDAGSNFKSVAEHSMNKSSTFNEDGKLDSNDEVIEEDEEDTQEPEYVDLGRTEDIAPTIEEYEEDDGVPEAAKSEDEKRKEKLKEKARTFEDGDYYSRITDEAEDDEEDDFDSLNADLFDATQQIKSSDVRPTITSRKERREPTSISSATKARIKAADLMYTYDLDGRYEKPLFEILLVKNCHSKTIAQLKRLFLLEVTPEELSVALEIREEWFYEGFSYCDGIPGYSSSGPCAQISWINAVLLSRMLRTDDIDAIVSYLWDRKAEWRRQMGNDSDSRNFNKYIGFYLEDFWQNVESRGDMLAIEDHLDSPCKSEEDTDFRQWHDLADYGLLTEQPKVRTSYFSDDKKITESQEY